MLMREVLRLRKTLPQVIVDFAAADYAAAGISR